MLDQQGVEKNLQDDQFQQWQHPKGDLR
jgi:hypothetical protein